MFNNVAAAVPLLTDLLIFDDTRRSRAFRSWS
jgi:hypothetical protein